MTFIDDAPDLQWLCETHLKGIDVPPFVCATIYGNEDCPYRIELFRVNHYRCLPMIYVLNYDDNGYTRVRE